MSKVAPIAASAAPVVQEQQSQHGGGHQSQQQHEEAYAENVRPSWPNLLDQSSLFGDGRTLQFLNSLDEADISAQLPGFVRPLPRKIDTEDVRYLRAKGALDFPTIALQKMLLQAYVEYVHPCMPLMDLHEFLSIVNRRDGLNGQISLLLFQAVMFAATAFVDMKTLREAGYLTRKAARQAFFQKTRVSLIGSPHLLQREVSRSPFPCTHMLSPFFRGCLAALRPRLRIRSPGSRPVPHAYDVLVRDP